MLTAHWQRVSTARTRVCFQEEEQGAKGAPVPPWAPPLLAPARVLCPPAGPLASLTGTALTSASAALTAAPTLVLEVRTYFLMQHFLTQRFPQGLRPRPETRHPGTAMTRQPAPSQWGPSRPRPPHSTGRPEAAGDETCHNKKHWGYVIKVEMQA